MAAEYLERMGRRMRQRREELGLSRDEVARQMVGKTNGNAIYRWERGDHRPQNDTIEELANVLGVNVSYFFMDEPEEGSPDLMGALSSADQTQLDRLEAKVDDLTSMVNELLSQIAALELGATLEPEIPLPDEHIERRAATQARTTRSRAAS